MPIQGSMNRGVPDLQKVGEDYCTSSWNFTAHEYRKIVVEPITSVMRPDRKRPASFTHEVRVVMGHAEVVDDFEPARIFQEFDGKPLPIVTVELIAGLQFSRRRPATAEQ